MLGVEDQKNSPKGGRENLNPSKKSNVADWRVDKLAKIRRLIHDADPEVVEEIKWRKPSNPDGVPVWSHDGIICTGETYKNHLRFTFANGSSIKDPKHLFNANLEGVTRAIVINEGDEIKQNAFKTLIRTAVALNESLRKTKSKSAKS